MGFKHRKRKLGDQPDRDFLAVFSVVVERGQNAVLLANDEQRYIYANSAACRLLGYSREELLSMCVWDITPESHAADGKELWRQFIEGGEQRGEYRVRRKDGKIRVCEYSAVANIARGVHVSDLHDVTERAQAEDLQRARAEEKQLLLREMQHRIKNVLSTVVALIRLQLSDTQQHPIEARIARLTTRVEAMAASATSRLEGGHEGTQSSSGKRLLFAVARAVIATSAIETEHISFSVEGDDCRVSWNKSDPIALILNEVLANYLQHSTQAGEKTDIRFRIIGPDGSLERLSVDFSRPFSSAPETWREHFGMQLIGLLASQVDARIQWQQGESSASFRLSLKRQDDEARDL